MERTLNAVLVLIIAAILFGALAIQLIAKEEPCAFCLLQRIGMFGVACGALMNCRFGPHRLHYGLSLIAAVLGGTIALRQIALHVCPGFPTFGVPFWGLSLYTWSFLVFTSSVVYIALLLILFSPSKEETKRMNGISHLAFYILFSVTCINIIVVFLQCGFGVCE